MRAVIYHADVLIPRRVGARFSWSVDAESHTEEMFSVLAAGCG